MILQTLSSIERYMTTWLSATKRQSSTAYPSDATSRPRSKLSSCTSNVLPEPTPTS